MPSSIFEVLNDGQPPDAIAIQAPGKRPLTYGRLREHTGRILGQMHHMGYGRGDRIAVVLPNGPDMAVAFLAVASGFSCAPLNPAYREEELAFYLRDLRADAVLVPADDPGLAATVAGSLGIPVITLSPAGDEAGVFTISGGRGKGAADAACAGPGDVAMLLHTSGTTSRPKLVPLLQSSIVASACDMAQPLALGGTDKCLNVMPLFHIHGLLGAVTTTLVSGGCVVCAPGPVFPDFFGWLREYRPTWYTAVPTIHQKALELARAQPDLARQTSLRFIRSSSAAMPPAVAEGLEAAFGVPVIAAYGMTEAPHQISTNPLPPQARKESSVGRGTGVEIAIMDERGHLLPPGGMGEIVLRGTRIFRGYENNPEANAKAFVGGWFLTGDRGHLDEDGYLYVDARLKEIINKGGEKISPREVEDALLSHPAVREAAAFSVPDPALGEDVGAAVVLKEGAATDVGSLKKYVSGRLAYFKAPAKLWLVDAIPKGPTGKVQRVGMFERISLITAPEAPAVTPDYEPPETATEAALAGIWARVLSRDRIGRHGNFLELGGDSLQATMVASRIREALGITVPIARVMDSDGVAGLAALIDDMVARAHEESR